MPSEPAAEQRPRVEWKTNLVLFLATVASVIVTGAQGGESIVGALQFCGALLTILVAHELGHFITARIHRVDASLPFFIPMPILSPFGTMGAVIRMRSTIPTRRALLDIGASGPIAGMVFAIPMYIWGIASSKLVRLEDSEHSMQLGQSLLLSLLDKRFGPAVPEGMDVMVSPVAYAAWAGMFVTMINLLPVGQLDGGHVAYALFGPRQNRIAQWVHRSMLVFFFVSLAGYLARDLRAGFGLMRIGSHVQNSIFWLVWFEILGVLGALTSTRRPPARQAFGPRARVIATLVLALVAGVGREYVPKSIVFWVSWFVGLGFLLVMEARFGILRDGTLLDHPPTGAEKLGWGRALVAVLTLALFAVLFMPTPLAFY